MASHSSDSAPSHHGLGFYAGILLALLCLTLLTFLTAREWDAAIPSALHVPLALAIALVKGSLVVWFFMHLGQHTGTSRVYFGLSLFFLALMISMIWGDVATRLPSANPNYESFKELKGSW